jgi:hypothetical protein
MTLDDDMEQQRSSIRDSVLSEISHRRTRRRRLTLAAVAGAGLAVVAGVAIGGTQLVRLSPAVEHGAASCYWTDDPAGEVEHFFADEPQPFDVVELCSQFWQFGQIGQTPPAPQNDFSNEYPVPEIAVCFGSDGMPWGFPIWDDETEKQLCDRLGLPVYDGP